MLTPWLHNLKKQLSRPHPFSQHPRRRRRAPSRLAPSLETLEIRTLLSANVIAGAGEGGAPHVRVFDEDQIAGEFFTYESAFRGGARVAAGDVNGDGVVDFITGAGPGGGPHVKVFDGADPDGGTLLADFFAFDLGFRGGVFVAAGNFDSDPLDDEIVVGADAGGGPNVKIFKLTFDSEGDLDQRTQIADFFAFDRGFTGGVRVAAGDVNNDGRDDVITGAGPGGGPHVKVFSGADLTGNTVLPGLSFFAYDSGFRGGVYVAAGNLDIDLNAEIITGAGAGGGPNVKVFDQNGSEIGDFLAYDSSFRGGVRVGAINVNGDSVDDILTGPGPGGGPHVKVFDGTDPDGGTPIADFDFFAFDSGFRGGIFVAGRLAPPSVPPTQADLEVTKTIDDPNATAGAMVTFTVTVTNKGPATATNVEVTDLLPSGYEFEEADPSQGDYDDATGIWTVGDLEANASATLEILVTVLSTGEFVNTAEVTAVDQTDPDSTPGSDDPAEDDQASAGVIALSIDDVSQFEGDTGATPFVFTVTLSAPASNTVTVAFATANGSATASSDYVATTGTLTFVPGQTTKTIAVTVNGDTMIEPDKTFFVNLSSATGAVIADSQGLGTILNDDPSISIDDVSELEGDAGTKTFVFTVSLSDPSTEEVKVDFATANGTATAGSDYVAASGTLTFAPATTSQTIAVTVIGDAAIEPDETFFVNLSNPTGAAIADNQGVGTIRNDDVSISIDDVEQVEGTGGTTSFVFTATLSAAALEDVTVDFATANDSATATSDYVAASGTLTFPQGTTTQTISVTVIGDAEIEFNETFFVNLTDATGAVIADDQGIGTILDDDVSLSIEDVSEFEGDSGTTTFTFMVTLSDMALEPVTVDFATEDGTAEATSDATSDYVANSGTLTFMPGDTTMPITVTVIGDTENEPAETFLVELFNPTNAVIADGQGVGTIENDDLFVSIEDFSQEEGDSGITPFMFTVTLHDAMMGSATALEEVRVDFETADGSAEDEEGDGDYVAATGTLIFALGETTKTITVEVIGDTDGEPDETFTVTLSDPVNVVIDIGVGLGTIEDDDAP